MNLIARSNERAPSALSSTASESPVKTRHESQSPLSLQAEKYDRTGRPIVCSKGAHRPVVYAHSSSYSEWNIDKTWSSQEGKSDELMDDRTERLVVCRQGGAHTSQTRFSREHKNVILEEEENHDRTGTTATHTHHNTTQHHTNTTHHFTFNGYAGTLDPAQLIRPSRQSPTMVMATPPHEQQAATLLYPLTMLTQKGARKVVRKAGSSDASSNALQNTDKEQW